MATTPAALTGRVQVNIPFPFLVRNYLPLFLEEGLNPEIGLDAWSLTHYPPATFRRMGAVFHRAGRAITLHGPFQDIAPGSLDDAVLAAARRRLRQAFRQVPVFKPAAIVCHLGYDARHYRWDLERWLGRAAATFTELAALAAAHGVRVMLENVYETEPELFVEVITRVGAPNLGVCFDAGHLLAFGGGDFPHWLQVLTPHIGQLHLHDNQGDEDSHLALGTGKVPLELILTTLAGRNPRPIVTLEPHQEGSLAPSLEHLARLWPWE